MANWSGKGRQPQLEDSLKYFDDVKGEQTDEEVLTLFKKIAGKRKGK